MDTLGSPRPKNGARSKVMPCTAHDRAGRGDAASILEVGMKVGYPLIVTDVEVPVKLFASRCENYRLLGGIS